jgi:hypothetical protein
MDIMMRFFRQQVLPVVVMKSSPTRIAVSNLNSSMFGNIFNLRTFKRRPQKLILPRLNTSIGVLRSFYSAQYIVGRIGGVVISGPG